jgi:hypothetical protein
MSSPARPSAARIRTYGAAAQAGARYVLAGALDKVNDRLRYTAQLFDGASGHELWSARYDDEGVDPKAPGPDIGTRIYDALAGLEGRLYAEEERRSWSKDEASLDGYDYYLRGASLFLRFTPEDNEKALTVFAEGLKKYPNEALLQVKLAWCFLMRVDTRSAKTRAGTSNGRGPKRNQPRQRRRNRIWRPICCIS